MSARYPKIVVTIPNPPNPSIVLGKVMNSLSERGVSVKEISEFREEFINDKTNNFLGIAAKWVRLD